MLLAFHLYYNHKREALKVLETVLLLLMSTHYCPWTTGETHAADEDHVKWLKAPEKKVTK